MTIALVPVAVGALMTARVVKVEMDDRLEVVRQIFERLSFHHLLVVDEFNKLVGVVSDRDLLKALSPQVGSAWETERDRATLNKRVHQIMSRTLITLHRHAPLNEAVQLFIDHRISCIPIVDEASKPVGILSWRDVMKSLLDPAIRSNAV